MRDNYEKSPKCVSASKATHYEQLHLIAMPNTLKQLRTRMMRAALAEKELYWELALDPGAIRQSVLAVLIVAAAWGIGSAIDYLLDGDTGGAVVGFLVTGLWALSFWIPFSGFAFVITRIMAKIYEVDIVQESYPQFVRSVGFVATPGILIILTPIPFVGEVAILMAFIWMALATAVAIQHTLEAPIGLAVMGAFGGMVAGLVLSVFVRVYLLP